MDVYFRAKNFFKNFLGPLKQEETILEQMLIVLMLAPDSVPMKAVVKELVMTQNYNLNL